jgi:hypothetical protein
MSMSTREWLGADLGRLAARVKTNRSKPKFNDSLSIKNYI